MDSVGVIAGVDDGVAITGGGAIGVSVAVGMAITGGRAIFVTSTRGTAASAVPIAVAAGTGGGAIGLPVTIWSDVGGSQPLIIEIAQAMIKTTRPRASLRISASSPAFLFMLV